MNTQQELTDKQVTPQPQQWQSWCMDSLQGLMSWVPNRNRQNMKKTWRGNIQVSCLHILKQHLSYCSFNLFNNKLFELHWAPNPDAVTIITTTTTTITTTTTTITKTTTSSSTTTTTTKTTITTKTITTTMSLTTKTTTTTTTTTTTYIRDTF